MLCLFFFHYRILRIIVVVVFVVVSSFLRFRLRIRRTAHAHSASVSTQSIAAQPVFTFRPRKCAVFKHTNSVHTYTSSVHSVQCTLHSARCTLHAHMNYYKYIFWYFVVMHLDHGQPHQTETRMRIERKTSRRIHAICRMKRNLRLATIIFESNDKNVKNYCWFWLPNLKFGCHINDQEFRDSNTEDWTITKRAQMSWPGIVTIAIVKLWAPSTLCKWGR